MFCKIVSWILDRKKKDKKHKFTFVMHRYILYIAMTSSASVHSLNYVTNYKVKYYETVLFSIYFLGLYEKTV